jgi:membrane-bound metal-dependent hydrolase YbcI (DUF457 family)
MSPVGHAAAGLLGWQLTAPKKNAKSLLFFLVIANLPDIDFALFFFLGKQGFSLHQYFTHNVFFAGLAGLTAWIWFPGLKERAGILLTAYSHLLLDYLTVDGAAPYGFRLFFPLSDHLFNFGLLPNLIKSNLQDVFSVHNLLVLCFETLVFLLPVIVLCIKKMPPAALRGASGGQGEAPLGTPKSLREGGFSSTDDSCSG